MAKNVLQDIVPPEKRSIRNVPVPSRAGRGSSSVVSDIKPRERASSREDESNEPEIPVQVRQWERELPREYPQEQKYESPFPSKKGIWIASGVALIIVALAVMSLFTGATITITPKSEATSTTQTFTAKRDAQGGDLDFQIVKISKDLGKTVPANGEEKVERKASGQIIIYNNFNSAEQRLIKNTRFETPEGLTYRINESVVVPGKKDANTPGSVMVTVYADEAGEKYNIGLKDFTVPGFKGDPRFKDIYARSKTEMKGGFIGTVKKVSDSDKASTTKELDSSLTAQLKSDIVSQVPADFILYESGMFFSFESLPQTGNSATTADLNERGTLTGVMINRKKLSEYLANTLAQKVPKNSVAVSNLDSLSFKMLNHETFNPDTDSTVAFTLSGNISFVSQVDTEKLKSDLLGKSRSSFASILQNYGAILHGKEVVRPFWKRSFPTNLKDITIVIAPDTL